MSQLKLPSSLERRQFIQGSGSLFALTALSSNVASAITSGGTQVTSSGLVVYKPNDESSLQFASVLVGAGFEPIALEKDLVRQWRNGLSVAFQKQQKIIGLTDWSDYMLMRDFAAEQRLFSVLENQHTIAKQNASLWASDYASDLLNNLASDELLELQQAQPKETTKLHNRSLFSWVIR